MRKKMYWGIVTLIILLLGATAVLLLRDTDTEPEVIYKTDLETTRTPETPIAGFSFDFSVKLPTDAELPKYSEDKLIKLLHKASGELRDMGDEYVTQSRSLMEVAKEADFAKMMDLHRQERELGRVYRLLSSERRERIHDIHQYIGTLK